MLERIGVIMLPLIGLSIFRDRLTPVFLLGSIYIYFSPNQNSHSRDVDVSINPPSLALDHLTPKKADLFTLVM